MIVEVLGIEELVDWAGMVVVLVVVVVETVVLVVLVVEAGIMDWLYMLRLISCCSGIQSTLRRSIMVSWEAEALNMIGWPSRRSRWRLLMVTPALVGVI